MERGELDRYATGELIWELVRRRGVAAVSADGELRLQTAGPALALLFPGMTLRDDNEKEADATWK